MSDVITDSPKKFNSKLLWSVISGKYHPDQTWEHKSFSLKFMLRYCCYPRVSYRYLRDLTALETFGQRLEQQGLLPAKIHRPYLQSDLRIRQRAAAIISHYRLLETMEAPRLRQFLSQTCQRPLLEWTAGQDQSFMLSCGSACFDREGEVMLCLHFQQQLVAMVTFTLLREEQTTVLFIGGLQGPNQSIPADMICQATRAAQGVFPKRLLREVIFWLACSCEAGRVQAVSETGRVFRRLRYRYSKQDKFFASYSSFWESLGGVPDSLALYK